MTRRTARPAAATGLATLLALALSGALATPALASSTDSDGDGLPNAWEKTYRLDPHDASDARRDADRDGSSNLKEFRAGSSPRDEDSDDDGQDDGDEVGTGTSATDPDSDDDGVRDGDEDADGDGVKNEDEDDTAEGCAADDDDTDHDGVDDEDEDELRLVVGDTDSDDDGVADGTEDRDRDGVQNEDEDDAADDSCSGDRDGDGEDDEDEDDVYGTVTSYDGATRLLVVAGASGLTYSFTLATDPRLEFEDADGVDCGGGGDDEASEADLVPGAELVDVDVRAGVVDRAELLRRTC